ncbi:MAG: Uma2 family endonuclease [Thermomicrobiales bacterium]
MVASIQAERPYIADDLASLPDDGKRYEIIGGELFVSPAPAEPHQRASYRLLKLIGAHVDTNDLGLIYHAPFGVFLSDHDVLQPDILVVLKENRSRIQGIGIVGPPDLIVEIVSPSSTSIDRIRKRATYATFGVQEYWIVDPDDQTIHAQALVGQHYEPILFGDGLVRSTAIAGLVIDPAEVFAVPDWMPSADT